jgi:micrococcal nuclease
MQNLITLVMAAIAAMQTLSVNNKITRSDPVLVKYVIDGDTIEVSTVGRVRLLGIDAPELGRGFDTAAPFGREARDRLTTLILNRWIRLEQEGPSIDTYSRRLAYVVTEDGQFVNGTLVREGLARVSARLPLIRLPELRRAEAEAQAFRRGMWGSTPQIPTSSYTQRSGSSRPPGSSSQSSSKRRSTRKKKP